MSMKGAAPGALQMVPFTPAVRYAAASCGLSAPDFVRGNRAQGLRPAGRRGDSHSGGEVSHRLKTGAQRIGYA